MPARLHAAHEGRALAGLRRELDALPETRHPLGLSVAPPPASGLSPQ
ncbi:hypothetical protein [Baekduia alba]|nr:hypothetical protein [Baekduia alba]